MPHKTVSLRKGVRTAVLLPYPIKRILTGQFIRSQGCLRSAEVVPGEPT